MSKLSAMRMATGRVIDGKVVIEGEPFEDGTVVSVVALEDGESIEDLTPEQEAELLEAIAEIDRGEGIDGAEFLRSLKRRVE